MKSTKVQTLSTDALHTTTACTDDASIKSTQLCYCLVSCLVQGLCMYTCAHTIASYPSQAFSSYTCNYSDDCCTHEISRLHIVTSTQQCKILNVMIMHSCIICIILYCMPVVPCQLLLVVTFSGFISMISALGEYTPFQVYIVYLFVLVLRCEYKYGIINAHDVI